MNIGIDQHIFSPITLRFKNAGSEAAFSKWIMQKRNIQMRLALLVVLILYLMLSFIDASFSLDVYRDNSVTIHRYLLPLLLLGTIMIGSFERTKSYFMVAALIVTLVAACCNLYLVSLHGITSAYVPELYFMILWIFTIAGFRFLTAAALSLLIITMAMLNAFMLESSRPIDLTIYTFWLWVAFILGFLGGHLLEYFSKTSFYNEHRLIHHAEHDPLTGVANRTRFNDRLEHAIARASREEEKIAIVYIDLDRFKMLNDTHGHDAGDAYLRDITQRILSHIRSSDTLSRIGGDEFIVMLEDVGTIADAMKIAQMIQTSLSKPYTHKETLHFKGGASIGVAIFPDHSRNKEDLLQFADKAMYSSKAKGGDHTTLYSSDAP
ncbi:MAG: GGDEF domain-containing protein [Sulfurovum sp.]|nr:GGDEF domain-containing protein [Sulfurovum sp.]